MAFSLTYHLSLPPASLPHTHTTIFVFDIVSLPWFFPLSPTCICGQTIALASVCHLRQTPPSHASFDIVLQTGIWLTFFLSFIFLVATACHAMPVALCYILTCLPSSVSMHCMQTISSCKHACIFAFHFPSWDITVPALYCIFHHQQQTEQKTFTDLSLLMGPFLCKTLFLAETGPEGLRLPPCTLWADITTGMVKQVA